MATQEALSNAASFTQEQLSSLFKPPYTYDDAKNSTGFAENEPIDNLRDQEFVDNSLDDDRFFEGIFRSLHFNQFLTDRT